jgi:hypothetical protein
VAKGKAWFGIALACALAVPAAAPACSPDGRSKAEIAAREKATNRALLEALLQRRSEIARSAQSAQSKRHALSFLDGRIAEVRRRMAD